MRRLIFLLGVLLTFAPMAAGQGSGANTTAAALRAAASLPAEPCVSGQVRYRTGGTPGGFVCVSGTWTSMGVGGATAGGSPTQLQYNASGSLAGISGFTSDGTNVTAGTGNLRATSPRFTTGLLDANGNRMMLFSPAASAVNEITFANAATGGTPSFAASGNDANIGLTFRVKGAADHTWIWDAASDNNYWRATSIGTLQGNSNTGGLKFQLVLASSAPSLRLASDTPIEFNNTNTLSSGSRDTAMARFLAGVVRFSNAGAGAGGIVIGPNTSSGEANTLWIERHGIGTTSSNGLVLANPTAAAAGAPQYSPRIRWAGQGWKTNATAGSQTTEMIAELQPVDGAANPASVLSFAHQVNNGGFAHSFSLSSGGLIGKYNSAGSADSFAGVGTFNSATVLRTGIYVSSDDVFIRHNSGDQARFVNQGGLRIRSGNCYAFSSVNDVASASDAFLCRGGSANLRFGAADATSPIAQTVSVQNVLAGTSNTAGANVSYDGSRGTGTGAGGAHVWRVAPAGSSGSSQNALVERMRLDENGLRFPEISTPSAPPSNSVSLYAKDKSGVSTLYYRQDNGTEVEIGASSTGYTAPPAVGSFTWVNQGGASAATVGSDLVIEAPAGASANLRLLVISTPATPYTLTVALKPVMFGADFASVGVAWRESGTGRLAPWVWAAASGYKLQALKYTDTGTYNSLYQEVAYQPVGDAIWLRAADDGTNRTVSISSDGVNWVQFHQVSRTDFLTADQIGLVVNAQNATFPVKLVVKSWQIQ